MRSDCVVVAEEFAEIGREAALQRASSLPYANRISLAVGRAPDLGDDRPFHWSI
jgi:hypothetical protein